MDHIAGASAVSFAVIFLAVMFLQFFTSHQHAAHIGIPECCPLITVSTVPRFSLHSV